MVTKRGRFARLLHEYRTDAGQSMSAIAIRAGLDHSYLSRLENDERVPSRDVVDALARALEVVPAARDRLMMAAGYLPESLAGLIDEPELLSLVRRLRMERSAA